MNICKTEQEFTETVAPYAQKACKAYGFYLPSVLIAQAAKELGYAIPSYWDNPGVRGLVEENNMVGIKKELLNKTWVDIGLSVWDGRYLNKKTPEVYGGVPVQIYDDFRIYDNPEQSFADYLCFMRWGGYSVGNPKYYNDIKDVKDYRKLIQIVHQKGYATGPTYSSGVIAIIQKHNLTRYDDLTGVEPTKYVPAKSGLSGAVNTPAANTVADTIAINPNPNFEPKHNTSARSCKIEYIYIHYVGATGDAKANIDYYNQLSTTSASADFYVGHGGDIWQYNMDPEHRYCWAVGGGRQSSHGGEYFGIAKNANGISIEMCVRNKINGRQSANAPSWYFEMATVDACVKLTKYLMKKYSIPADHVIRHYDVNGKYCPGVVGWNDASGDDSAWKAFKQRISDGTPAVSLPEQSTASTPIPAPSGTKFRVQVGAYKKKGNATNKVKSVKSISGLDSFIELEADGMYHVYCGSYTVKVNADQRVAMLWDKWRIKAVVEVR